LSTIELVLIATAFGYSEMLVCHRVQWLCIKSKQSTENC
jgi:hypothetical protein